MTASGGHRVAEMVLLGNAIRALRRGPAAVQPRSLTAAEQRARATRPDLWPTFAPPPAVPLDDVDDGLDALDDPDPC